MRSYLEITVHYITGNWKLEHIVLGCNRVQGRHTAVNIQFWYDEVVSDFGISEKVKHNITDSGSNIKKAFTQVTLPGYEEEDTDDLSDEDEDKDNFESISTSSLDGFSFERHACFAHTLQLVIKDGLARACQLNSVIKNDAQSWFHLFENLPSLLTFLKEKNVFNVTMPQDGIPSYR